MARVMVGMSGGVDSSVAAFMLLQQGHDVAGITLKLYDGLGRTDNSACLSDDINDAKRVASKLGIPHFVLDYERAFIECVIDPFVDTYCRGQTPNPCVLCNKQIKFGKLIDHAKTRGYDYMATGHYAGIERDLVSGRYVLRRGQDLAKDQTYFLYTLTQEQLAATLFPLTNLVKNQARQVAVQQGIITARKSDSQDICFIPDGDHGRFIDEIVGDASGLFVDIKGNVLGRHKGIYHYTIGQRRGLGIGGQAEPLYVIAIEHKTNTVVLGEESHLFMNHLTAMEMNWFLPPAQGKPVHVHTKIRAAHRPVAATIICKENGNVDVTFHADVRAISPGQAVVFYDGDRVLGGGTIKPFV